MKKEIVIKSTVGLHASLAAKIVQAASNYAVDIFLHYKDETIDVKSILGLMSLAVPCGENVVFLQKTPATEFRDGHAGFGGKRHRLAHGGRRTACVLPQQPRRRTRPHHLPAGRHAMFMRTARLPGDRRLHSRASAQMPRQARHVATGF